MSCPNAPAKPTRSAVTTYPICSCTSIPSASLSPPIAFAAAVATGEADRGGLRPRTSAATVRLNQAHASPASGS